MMMPAAVSNIADLFRDPADRNRAIGVCAATSRPRLAIGPVASGLLTQHLWWGSVFWLNIPS